MPKLTNPDTSELLALHMAKGGTIASWAQSVGKTPRSCYRMAERPGFRDRVRALQAEIVARALGRLVRDSVAAEATLKRLMKSESDKVALGASVNILKLLMDLQSHAQLSDRIAELERKLNEQSKH